LLQLHGSAIGTDRPCGNVRLSARHLPHCNRLNLLDPDIG
jgi:hypothetical protein